MVSPTQVMTFYVNRRVNSTNGLHEIHWGDVNCVYTWGHRAYFDAEPNRSSMRTMGLRRIRRDGACLDHDFQTSCKVSFCGNCIEFEEN